MSNSVVKKIIKKIFFHELSLFKGNTSCIFKNKINKIKTIQTKLFIQSSNIKKKKNNTKQLYVFVCVCVLELSIYVNFKIFKLHKKFKIKILIKKYIYIFGVINKFDIFFLFTSFSNYLFT